MPTPASNDRSTGLFLVVSLLSLLAVLNVSSMNDKSPTFDEAAHITSGYHYWHHRDFTLNSQNGLLPQSLVSFPLTYLDLNYPKNLPLDNRNLWVISDTFMYHSDNMAATILKLSRLMVLIPALLTALLVYHWSSQLWGRKGALFSLFLYVMSPSILAHSHLATSDITATFAFTLSLFTIWKLLTKPCIRYALLAGASIAILLISKMSSIIIAPVLILLLLIKFALHNHDSGTTDSSSPGFLSELAYIIIIPAIFSILIVNLVYSVELIQESFNTTLHARLSPAIGQPISLLSQSGILPDRFLNGLMFVLSRTSDRLSFAAGQFSLTGWWWYMPFTFLIKTPVSILAALFLTAALLIRHNKNILNNKPVIIGIATLTVFICIYLLIAMASKLSIGHRHMLPVYPALFILSGLVATRHNLQRKLIIPLLCLFLLFENISVYPHYLSFLNIVGGGPKQGFRQLVDSSYDWGQDLPSLKKWEQQHPDRSCNLLYFGTADPEHYIDRCKIHPGFLDLHATSHNHKLEPGWYIISSTLLQLGIITRDIQGPWSESHETMYQQLVSQNPENMDSRLNSLKLARLINYLKKREADDHIAYSLLAFNVTANMLEDALNPSASYNRHHE